MLAMLRAVDDKEGAVSINMGVDTRLKVADYDWDSGTCLSVWIRYGLPASAEDRWFRGCNACVTTRHDRVTMVLCRLVLEAPCGQRL